MVHGQLSLKRPYPVVLLFKITTLKLHRLLTMSTWFAHSEVYLRIITEISHHQQ